MLTALGTFRVMVPLGPVGPFVVGGVGPGYVSEPSNVGLAYMGGGGLIIQAGTHFAFGAEVTYQGITGTPFSALFIGPILSLSF